MKLCSQRMKKTGGGIIFVSLIGMFPSEASSPCIVTRRAQVVGEEIRLCTAGSRGTVSMWFPPACEAAPVNDCGLMQH